MGEKHERRERKRDVNGWEKNRSAPLENSDFSHLVTDFTQNRAQSCTDKKKK